MTKAKYARFRRLQTIWLLFTIIVSVAVSGYMVAVVIGQLASVRNYWLY